MRSPMRSSTRIVRVSSHRDVKPANVLLSETHAVIAVFGIARVITEGTGAKLTETGTMPGTPAYLSPEQVVGGTVAFCSHRASSYKYSTNDITAPSNPWTFGFVDSIT